MARVRQVDRNGIPYNSRAFNMSRLDFCPSGEDQQHDIADLERECFGEVMSESVRAHVDNCYGRVTWM